MLCKHSPHVRARTRVKQVYCLGAKFKEELSLRVMPVHCVRAVFSVSPSVVVICNSTVTKLKMLVCMTGIK